MAEKPPRPDADEELSPEVEAIQQELWDDLLAKIHAEVARIAEQRDITKEQAMQILDNRLKTRNKDRIEYGQLLYPERQGNPSKKRAILDALTPNEKGELELPSYHLYIDDDRWGDVSEDPAYNKVKKDLELLKRNITEILKVMGHKGAENLTLSDFGPGIGWKIRRIIMDKILVGIRKNRLKLGEKLIRKMKLNVIDTNYLLLEVTIMQIFSDIIEQFRLNKNKKLNENHPWKTLIDFIIKHDLKLDKRTGSILCLLKWDFYELIKGKLKWKNGEPIEHFVQYAFARYFGFETYNDDLLEEFINEVEMPLDMAPILINFEDVDFSQFHTSNDTAQGILHLGDEVCNGFIDDKIAEMYPDLCGKAVPIDEEAHKQNPDDENNVKATYITFSLQTSHFDTLGLGPEELSPDREQISSAYNNYYFNRFVTHLFDDNKLAEFYNPHTGEDYLNHADCYDLEADFCEDPDHPGYYGSFHHIVFNRDTSIAVTVDGERKTFKLKKGQRIKLLSSYKPTMGQLEKACAKQNLKIVKTYQDEEETNAVIVIRAMTEYEQSLQIAA